MIKTAAILVVALVFITPVQADDKSKEPAVGLERKLHGEWKGPACGGDWTYKADGTFEVQHYTPGNNRLTGTWEVRWNALPPTLVRTIQTSDAPDRLGIGKTWEVKLVQLDDEALAYQDPDQYPNGHTVRYTRMKVREALERKLHWTWQGGDCIGELTLNADGTFERQHFTPGNNYLTGTWEVQWHALPLSLILICETSDDPAHVGKTMAVKLIQLDGESLVYQHEAATIHYERVKR